MHLLDYYVCVNSHQDVPLSHTCTPFNVGFYPHKHDDEPRLFGAERKRSKKGRQENVKKVLQMFDISLKPVCQIAQLLLILVVVSKVSSSEIHKYKQDKFHITFVLSLKQTSTILLNVVF